MANCHKNKSFSGHEERRYCLQHRSLRLRDRRQVAGGELQQEDQHQTTGRQIHTGREEHHSPGRGTSSQPGLCHGTSL